MPLRRICHKCESEFYVRPYREATANFCSKQCAYTDLDRAAKSSARIRRNPIPNSENYRYKKGHVQPLSSREKMRGKRPNAKPWNKKPDVFLNCEYCHKKVQIKPAFEGKQRYCSRPCANKGKDLGLTSMQKKLRTSLCYKEWRTAVFERDSYTCQVCSERGTQLNADHIKRFADYPDLRFDISNGRTLCVSCHKKTPTYGNRRQVAVA